MVVERAAPSIPIKPEMHRDQHAEGPQAHPGHRVGWGGQVWDYRRRSRPRIAAALAEGSPTAEIITITRRAQTRAILAAVGA
jgi:hypothetical protein